MRYLKEELLNCIPFGKKNSIHLLELSNLLHVSTRETKLQIQMARREGALILSAPCGYWQTHNPEEIQRFKRSMAGQAKQRMRSIARMKDVNVDE